MRRGDVWWVEIPGPAGRRPAVIVTRDSAIQFRSVVAVVPLTTRIRNIPQVEVMLGPAEGLPRVCVANCDVIQSIEKSHLRGRITTLDSAKLSEIKSAIRFALALE